MRIKGIVFTLALGILLGPLAAEAQQTGKLYRIGFLGNSTAALEVNLVGPFREGLRDLGYVEGRNVLIEYRWAEGKYERFPALIGELVALKVDVIVTAGTPATIAVKKATTSVPLVMVAVGDPVGTGILPSLSRPGGNITGLTSISPELDGKRLELLREVIPNVSHIAVLWNAASPLQVVAEKQTQAAAQVLRMKVLSLGVRTEEEIASSSTGSTSPSISRPPRPLASRSPNLCSFGWMRLLSDQMPTLASELVRLNPHVIVAGAGRAAIALKAATKTVPIVMANSADAVVQGLVASE